MRISDWSSDVCSSDLDTLQKFAKADARWSGYLDIHAGHRAEITLGADFDDPVALRITGIDAIRCVQPQDDIGPLDGLAGAAHTFEIGRASCRDRVVWYV